MKLLELLDGDKRSKGSCLSRQPILLIPVRLYTSDIQQLSWLIDFIQFEEPVLLKPG